MRRCAILLAGILLVFTLCIPAKAADASAGTGFYATVAADGSCQVTVTVNIHLAQALPELTFPVPAAAESITVNGSRVHPGKSGGVREIDLSRIVGNMAGDVTVNIGYSLPSVISAPDEDGNVTVTLPMLSGFQYPTSAMNFSITLPGQIRHKPAFSSGYFQSSIEQSMVWNVSGATVSGSATAGMKDHETLQMKLQAESSLFPAVGRLSVDVAPDNLWVLGIAAVAILYWLLFLRFWCSPFVRAKAEVQDDCGPGQLRSVLHMQGADLSLMVLHWAQLGYVTVRTGKNVQISRRMAMGNERSAFEQKLFNRLFDKRSTVNCSSLFYVGCCQKAESMGGERKHMLRGGSGSLRLYRGISALAMAAGGVYLGLSAGNSAATRVMAAMLFAVCGAVAGWHLQSWADELLMLRQKKARGTVVIAVLWLVLGYLSGQIKTALLALLVELVLGFLGTFGGRRTQWGKTRFEKTLSLRKYLLTAPDTELARIFRLNPEYFYSLSLYALALGVDKKLAARLRGIQLPACSYLVTGKLPDSMTAAQWSALARKTLSAMNARRDSLRTEQLFATLRAIRGR